jgi:hypothetical protein
VSAGAMSRLNTSASISGAARITSLTRKIHKK